MGVQTKPIKYYINASGGYEGAFDEGNAAIDGSWTEISAPPPDHASQTTTDNGATWSVYVPPPPE